MHPFIIIDGSSMLVTNFYASAPKELMTAKTDEEIENAYKLISRSVSGRYDNGVKLSLKQILRMINTCKPCGMAVLFDKSRDTFRRRIYPDYKGTRKPTPAPLQEQFLYLEGILSDIGIKVLFSDDFEADDLAGSIVNKFRGSGMEIRLITKDHDYLQLVSENVRCWMLQKSDEEAQAINRTYGVRSETIPYRIAEFGPDAVSFEMSVTPEQIVDLKAIAGDTADNIPGVKGVSTATAELLLQKYEDAEDMYIDIHSHERNGSLDDLVKEWKETLGIKRSPLKALVSGEAVCFMSKKLATIKTNVPVPENITDYQIALDSEKLKTVLDDLSLSVNV